MSTNSDQSRLNIVGRQPTNLREVEKAAEETVNKKWPHLWSYINRATGHRQTYNDSIAVFQRYRFQPRILSARKDRNTSTTVLGHSIRIPICVSPTAGQYNFAPPGGDIYTGRATAAAGSLMVYSSVCDISIEDFRAGVRADAPYWVQMYLYRDRRNTLDVVRKAEKLGFKALLITVDSPIDYAEVDIFGENADPIVDVNRAPNFTYLDGRQREDRIYSDDELWCDDGPGAKEVFCYANWEDFYWLKSQTSLPIVMKGILTAEAARQAVRAGVSGILVSAHGGRQLESSPAPLDALVEVVEAVQGTNVEVYMDGGVRSGADVFKAMALGARAVFIGRPAIWGLALNGEDGLRRVLKILEDEFTAVMSMCGCSSIQDIDTTLVKHVSKFKSML